MGVLTRDMVPPQTTVLPRRRRSGPVLLREGEGAATLSRIPLVGSHSEAWLQSLIHDHPELLPVDDLEPSFAELVPAAMEVACKAGYIDNLFVTPQGDIVLVEAKLWNNPQARREVVAQTLDYVGALSAMSYVEFEAAILKARHDGSTGLHALIPPALEPLAEPDFIDAVTRNLARGRMLALVVGNGIREEVQQLASVLQSHAGAHFTFGLVEVGLWRDMATGDIVAVPDTLAQTVMIERGVVRIENGQPVIKPVEAKSTVMVKTISTELFDEALAKRDPALPAMLHAFVAKLASIGGSADLKTSLHLAAKVPGREQPIKLGYIGKNGQLWTDNIKAAGPSASAQRYLDRLAELVQGSLHPDSGYVTTNGKSAPFVDQLLREHSNACLDIIDAFVRESAAEITEGGMS